MKLSILQQDFLPALQAVSRSIGIRSTLPVLSNILLSTEDNKLKLAATNLEIGVIKFVTAEIADSGEVTIPAKTLLEVVQSLGPVKMEIVSSGEMVQISSGSFKANINGIDASEFPIIPLSEGQGISFTKESLALSSEILFASAVDEGRPTLTGILTQVSDGSLDLVATDGFRLGHRRIKLQNSLGVDFNYLIPKRTFEEIDRILSEEEADEVEIQTSANQNQIIFKIGQTIVSSRLIEGKFPSWEKIIPTKITARAVADRSELLSAVKLASVFAKSEANIVVIKLSTDKLTFTSETKEIGGQQNEISAQVEGEGLQIAFNAKFLMDAISAASASQLIMEFSGPSSPTLIKPVGEEGLEYIIMPVRQS